MAILVLGGAGYIGSHVVYELIEAGRDVLVADNLSTGFKAAIHPKARFYQLDIRDRQALDNLFEAEQIDCVFHFAASAQVGESMSDPLKYYDNNLYGTLVLLQAMVAHGVNKLIFLSTAATYGEPELVPVLETDKTIPANCYGQTKLAIEQMLAWAARAHGLRYVVLRCVNVCGAHPCGEIGEVHTVDPPLIPRLFQVVSGQRESVTIYGDDYPTLDGTCVRDYVHIMDLVRAHILALDYLQNGGSSNVFNVGNGVGCSVNEVIRTVSAVTCHPIPIVIGPRREGDPAYLVATSEKAWSVLGWSPRYDNLNWMVSSAWAWHKNHPTGYEK